MHFFVRRSAVPAITRYDRLPGSPKALISTAVRERLERLEDRKDTAPWSEVKRHILSRQAESLTHRILHMPQAKADIRAFGDELR
jgi:hypothetical protein